MKKSVVAAAAAGCLFFCGNVFALTIEEEIALLKEDIAKIKTADKSGSISEALGISVKAGGTVIMQGTNKVNDGSGKGRNDATYSIDLGFEKEFSYGGRVFMHLDAGNGGGLDSSVITYGGINGAAASTADGVEVLEFLYEQKLFDEKFTVTFGKLSPAGCFNEVGYFDENEYANSEKTQFISPMFVNNPVIAFTDSSLGLKIIYSPAEKLDITYAYMTSGWDNMDTGGFNAIEVNIKPFEGANYRLMYWASNEEMEKFKNGEKTGGYGFAVNLDQAITETVGVFGRFGWADPSVYDLSMSWSAGVQLGGSMWTREGDIIGFAVGQIMPSGDFSDAEKFLDPDFKDDSETLAELYYSFAVNDNLAITPAIQYISKPLGGNAAGDDIFVYGIRVMIKY
ncbi:MAG: carbohydrate porin [Endomicrobia bacterium]|nr:carbohydrate porin [Endomicrobiia bacterium]